MSQISQELENQLKEDILYKQYLKDRENNVNQKPILLLYLENKIVRYLIIIIVIYFLYKALKK